MTKAKDINIPIIDLHERLSCDFETGVLKWRERPREHFPAEQAWRVWNAQNASRPVNAPDGKNYLQVSMTVGGKRRSIRAHRIVWAMAAGRWPANEIDHINHHKADNRLVNLREATHVENSANRAETRRFEPGERPPDMGITYNTKLPQAEADILTRYAAQTRRAKSEILREFIRSLERRLEKPR